MKKIHVGNLAYSTTDETLKDTFSKFGNVDDVKIIKDKVNGRSKGFGFVEMSDDGEAANAINELNGKEIDGRVVSVEEARPMERNSRPPFRGARRPSRRPNN